MIRFDLDIRGADAISAWLGRIPEQMRLRLTASMVEIVERLTGALRAGAPRGKYSTGRLVRSIAGKVETTEKSVTGRAQVGILAQIIEAGVNAHVDVEAHARRSGRSVISLVKAYSRDAQIPPWPFMRPAYDDNESFIQERIEKAIGGAADDT